MAEDTDELKWRHLARSADKTLRLHPVGGWSLKGDFVIVGYDLAIEPKLKKVEKPAVEAEVLKSVSINVVYNPPPPATSTRDEVYNFGWGGGLDHVERTVTETTEYLEALYTSKFQPLSREITGEDYMFIYYNNMFVNLRQSGNNATTIDGGKVTVIVKTKHTVSALPGVGSLSGIQYWRPIDLEEEGEAGIECDSTITFNTITQEGEESVEYEPVPDKADDFPRADYYPKVKKKKQQENGGEE